MQPVIPMNFIVMEERNMAWVILFPAIVDLVLVVLFLDLNCKDCGGSEPSSAAVCCTDPQKI
jgi:hypothetical protein